MLYKPTITGVSVMIYIKEEGGPRKPITSDIDESKVFCAHCCLGTTFGYLFEVSLNPSFQYPNQHQEAEIFSGISISQSQSGSPLPQPYFVLQEGFISNENYPDASFKDYVLHLKPN